MRRFRIYSFFSLTKFISRYCPLRMRRVGGDSPGQVQDNPGELWIQPHTLHTHCHQVSLTLLLILSPFYLLKASPPITPFSPLPFLSFSFLPLPSLIVPIPSLSVSSIPLSLPCALLTLHYKEFIHEDHLQLQSILTYFHLFHFQQYFLIRCIPWRPP